METIVSSVMGSSGGSLLDPLYIRLADWLVADLEQMDVPAELAETWMMCWLDLIETIGELTIRHSAMEL